MSGFWSKIETACWLEETTLHLDPPSPKLYVEFVGDTPLDQIQWNKSQQQIHCIQGNLHRFQHLMMHVVISNDDAVQFPADHP
jgi:hypothetical protein